MHKNRDIARAFVIVFLASACTMVLELIAGRILAPYIGVSLYTWTSIIGIILAGISLGNFIGGKISDRFTSPLVLSIILFAGAILSLAILPITGLLKHNVLLLAGWHIMSRTTIYSFVLFFLPTAILGMVTPVVIKHTLKDLGKTGNIVGTVYAISCVGSIVGTFLTGFLLISWFGTRLIIWLVAGVLFLMALLQTGLWKSKIKWSLIAASLIVFALVFQFRNVYQMSYLKESNYYTINIYDTEVRGRNVKSLVLDHLVHSYVDLNDPLFQGYGYEKTFAAVARYIARDKPDIKTLSIGGGGYTFPRFLEITYPHATIEVAEIDPAVTEVARSFLGVPADSRIVTYNMDARLFLMDPSIRGRYDLVIGDAFNDKSVPYHLTTFEFNESVRQALNPDGFYMVNIIDYLDKGQFVRSFMKTLELGFKSVSLFLPSGDWAGTGASTWVVIATNRGFELSDLLTVIRAYDAEFRAGTLVTLAEIESKLGECRATVLTDDYVPVDNMLAPLFTK